MTKVAILPVVDDGGGLSFRAVAGDRQSLGRTAGEALDALNAQFPGGNAGSLVIVQGMSPDRFFDTPHRDRLAGLMDLWRTARDLGDPLPAADQAELEALIDAELAAAAARAGSLADDLGR